MVISSGNNVMRKDITSHDGTKKLIAKYAGYLSERVYIESTQTDEVIKKTKETSGSHYGLGFSSDDKKVLYLTQPNHWYCGNAITVWDYERGDIWFLWTAHDRSSSITADSYSDDLSIVVLGDCYGEVSLIRPYEKHKVWLKNLAYGQKFSIDSLRLDEDKGVVWVSHEKGTVALSLEDGSAHSVYVIPSENYLH